MRLMPGHLAGAHELFDEVMAILLWLPPLPRQSEITPLNSTGNETVDVNNITVETGHWSFTTKPIYGKCRIPLRQSGRNVLSANWTSIRHFINAVRVVARRPDTPSFFARIFSIDEFFVSSEAVAYIGFAGTLHPEDS